MYRSIAFIAMKSIAFKTRVTVSNSSGEMEANAISKSLVSRGLLIVASLLLSISLTAQIAEKTSQNPTQLPDSVVKVPVSITLDGGSCEVLGIVLTPMFSPIVNEGEKSFTLSLKYKLDKQGNYAVLSALIEKGRLVGNDGKIYEPSKTKQFGRTYYSLMCVVPKDLDVETLKYTLNDQTIVLKDLEKLSREFMD